jgi:hypothetical protein
VLGDIGRVRAMTKMDNPEFATAGPGYSPTIEYIQTSTKGE